MYCSRAYHEILSERNSPITRRKEKKEESKKEKEEAEWKESSVG